MKLLSLFLPAAGLGLLATSAFAAEMSVPAENKDASGIMVHDGSAYIVQRLGSDLTLNDGTKIQPNGMMIGSDGAERPLMPGQLLSNDGQLRLAPFSSESDQSFLSTPLSKDFPGMRDTRQTEPAGQPASPQPAMPTEFGDFSD